MKQIIRKAYAKINLGLDVVRRRPDGYHEVKMIMQTISLHDELRFEEAMDRKSDRTRIEYKFSILLKAGHAMCMSA